MPTSKHYWLSLLFISLLFTSRGGPLTDEWKITGKVVDKKGTPLSGATVNVKGRKNSVITRADGTYDLSVPPSRGILVFSHVGFITQEKAFNGPGVYDITLREDQKALDEVVVVGYGTEKKRDVTGAIVSIKSAAINERQPVNAFDAMQGLTPGVQITSGSGAPGESSTIRIRGTATIDGGVNPLYIVDGAPMEDIDGINPADIASIEILKDAASAAIYGSRSANGVVLITTKRGVEGKPRFDLRYYTSMKQLAHKLPQANARERRMHLATGVSDRDSLNPAFSNDNDYQDLLTRIARRNQADLAVSGASKGLNYYASLGYLEDQGIIINSYSKLVRSRVNIDYKPNDKLAFGNRMQFSYQTGNFIDEGNVLLQGMLRPATLQVFLPDGSFAGMVQARQNPVAWAELNVNRNDDYKLDIYDYLSYQLAAGLKFTTDVTINIEYLKNFKFTPRSLSNVGDNTGADRRDFNTYLQWQGYLNYNRTFAKDHTVTGVLGISADKDSRSYIQISGSNFLTEAIGTFNAAQLLNQNSTLTSASRNTLASAFGRLGYSYKGKYIINTNMRLDGSSRFGKDNRWAFFPSVSGAWHISDEPFMRWTKGNLDDAKIRVSYGLTGNERIGDYDAIQRYSFGSYYYNSISGVVPNAVFGNNKLSWETTADLDLGIDLSFLNGRVRFVADWYDKTTTDLLYNAPLPGESGYSSVRVNVGSIENRGFEFGIDASLVRKKSFSWDVNYNMSFNNNRVRKLYNGTALTPTSGTTTWLVGEGAPLGQFYGWKALGVYQYNESNAYTKDWEQLTPVFNAQGVFDHYTYKGQIYTDVVQKLTSSGTVLQGGDVIWQNNHKDNVIDDADRTVIGNAQPLYTAGLTNFISYKDFGLSFTFYTSWGGQLFDYARYYINSYKAQTLTPQPDVIYTRWKKPGDISGYPRYGNLAYNQREISSIYIEDATYIRLRNVRLSYKLPAALASRARIQGISAYIYGANLLTWTNYRWYDPEIDPGAPLTMGKDSGRYPRYKEVGLGLNINF